MPKASHCHLWILTLPTTASASNLQLPPPPVDSGRQLQQNVHLLPLKCPALPYNNSLSLLLSYLNSTFKVQQPSATWASTCRQQTAEEKCSNNNPHQQFSNVLLPQSSEEWRAIWKPPPTASATNLQVPSPPADSSRWIYTVITVLFLLLWDVWAFGAWPNYRN